MLKNPVYSKTLSSLISPQKIMFYPKKKKKKEKKELLSENFKRNANNII